MRTVQPLHSRQRQRCKNAAISAQCRQAPVLLAAQQQGALQRAFDDPGRFLQLLPADVRRLIAGAISGVVQCRPGTCARQALTSMRRGMQQDCDQSY